MGSRQRRKLDSAKLKVTVSEPPSRTSPSPPVRGFWRRQGRFLAGLWLCALLPYLNSFRDGLPFDNQIAIVQDNRIHAATWANIDTILTTQYWFRGGATGLYRPLTTLSYLFNYAVLGNGTDPAGYHCINFLLHAINVAL